MRLLLLVCLLSTPAAGAFAQGTTATYSVGARLGIGSVGMPGLHSGSLAGDLAAGIERVVTRRDSIVAGIAYQPVSNVGYLDDASGAIYQARMASAFVGYKSRVAGARSGAYVGANIGATRWSGRPGDVRWTPSLGALVGVDLAVQRRSRAFFEFGTRFGKPDTIAPHWSLGFGYAHGL